MFSAGSEDKDIENNNLVSNSDANNEPEEDQTPFLEKPVNKCLVFTGLPILALLLVILLPLSFSYIEYYEYGLAQRKSTGKVDTSKVFARGRYLNGPDKKFLKYQADAHFVDFQALSVFSAGASEDSIGLEFKADISLTYFLKQDEIGLVHEELAKSYRNVIESRTRDAIKNAAIFVTFEEYFSSRQAVEQRFRDAVQARWDAAPPVHASLDQFHLGRIQIPESVADKQLEARTQVERNDKEAFLQQAQIEREKTQVEVNSISLDTSALLRTAEAEASLLKAKATAEASQILQQAQLDGAALLFTKVGITTQEEQTAFSYSRALQKRNQVDLDLTYWNPSGVIPTVEA